MATNRTATRRPAKGTPTSFNLSALADLFGSETEVPNAIPAPDTSHVRRCLRAGLVLVTHMGDTLTLTPAGVEALRTR